MGKRSFTSLALLVAVGLIVSTGWIAAQPLGDAYVTKTAEPAEVPAEGGFVVYTVDFINPTGSMHVLTGIVDDTFLDISSLECDTSDATPSGFVEVPPGASFRCSFERFVLGPPGTVHTNEVTAFFTIDGASCDCCAGGGISDDGGDDGGLSCDCCQPQGAPGCASSQECTDIVCLDPFCCDVEWDGICADSASMNCDCCGSFAGQATPVDDSDGDDSGRTVGSGGTSENASLTGTRSRPASLPLGFNGDCCAAGGNGTPGCDDPSCQDEVCALDSFCCNSSWDGVCAAIANNECEICGAVSSCGDSITDPGEDCDDGNDVNGDGCSAACESEIDGCNDQACQLQVCGNDPFCCTVDWDAECDVLASDICGCCALTHGETSAVAEVNIEDEELLVILESFTAQTDMAGRVRLRWETLAEIDTVGFRIYRVVGGGEPVRITGVIPSEGGELSGAIYNFRDGAPIPAGPVTYFLMEVDNGGYSAVVGTAEIVVSGKTIGGVGIGRPDGGSSGLRDTTGDARGMQGGDARKQSLSGGR